jgi:adenylate cyclase
LARRRRCREPLRSRRGSYVAEGDQFARSKEYDKAVEAYRQALRINPALAPAHYGLGAPYLNMGRPAEAVEPLRAAARLD